MFRFEHIHFTHPLFFLILLILPLLYLYEYKKRRTTFFYSYLPLLESSAQKTLKPFLYAPFWVRMFLLTLAVTALARPVEWSTRTEVETEGIDMVLTIDASASMKAEDFPLEGRKVNRLEAVKAVATPFIRARPHDRIGMVVFGDKAYTQAPPTLDHEFLLFYLNQLYPQIAGNATAIGDGLLLSVKALKNSDAKSKVIIFLTDGTPEGSQINPNEAVQIARQENVKIYSIGMGVPSGSYIHIDGRPIHVTVDEKWLKEAAEQTGGRYFLASNTQTLKEIYTEIDRLEKTPMKQQVFEEKRELFAYVSWPALLVLCLEALLNATRWRRLP